MKGTKHKDAYIIRGEKNSKKICNNCLKINTAEKVELKCKVYVITMVNSYSTVYNYLMHYASI